MQKLITTLAAASVFGLSAAAGVAAAPVTGFEAQYNSVYSNCTLPAGSVGACEDAINAYAGVLVNAVSIDEANASFSALRSEVFTANAADEAFQLEIDNLFELLLPESGAIGGGDGDVEIGDDLGADGGGGGTPASPS